MGLGKGGAPLGGPGARVGTESVAPGSVSGGNESAGVSIGIAVGGGVYVAAGTSVGVTGIRVGASMVKVGAETGGALVGLGVISVSSFSFAFSEAFNAFSSAGAETIFSNVRNSSCCRVNRFINSCESDVELGCSDGTAASEAFT